MVTAVLGEVTATRARDARQRVRTRVAANAVALWAGLGSWRDTDQPRFLETVIPLVEAARTVTMNVSAVEMAGNTATLTGETIDTAAIDRAGGYRRDVTDSQVFVRPFGKLWHYLAENHSLDDAVSMSGAYLGELVTTDMQIAHVSASTQALQKYEVTWYRRVLSGSESCALCVAASQHYYYTQDLMPIHSHCDCRVTPGTGLRPPQRGTFSDLKYQSELKYGVTDTEIGPAFSDGVGGS